MKSPEPLEYGCRASGRFTNICVIDSRTGEVVRRHADQDNLILDCQFGLIPDAAVLAGQIKTRAGIVEHGLFIGLTSEVIVAGPGGCRRLVR